MNSESPEFHERVKLTLQREMELMQKPFTETITRLQGELERKEQERRSMQDEIAQMRSEVARLKVRVCDAMRSLLAVHVRFRLVVFLLILICVGGV